jgi:hypothetical protein
VRILLISLFVFTITSNLTAQERLILKQSDAPISIINFEAEYQEESRYSSEGIRYDVFFQNSAQNNIVAYSFGFYAFDVFNRSLGRPLEGFSVEELEPEKRGSAAWVQRTINSSLFRKYGTAVAYISRVRFKDGTIWTYDEKSILEQLQKFEKSLTLDDLEAKK